ncbi:hypothetical protein DAEQUDRAFT_90987 [Daedalea quercina L-15889]|uniref:Peptidase C14 caspase domain-containing protein n=1 Tax=Daedalea quercina L-15889 TaxID=1314783 RepID=A0A165S815_9APHY|nr:hypothetical protein DAEQUDRAFT_90987 [Daedalea quercina L-15889]
MFTNEGGSSKAGLRSVKQEKVVYPTNEETLAPQGIAELPSDASPLESELESGTKTPTAEEEAASTQTLITLDKTGAESRIWALLIAIDKYSKAGPLTACVSDAKAMQVFLKTKLRVPESQIVTLFDEAAKREAILSTFRSHLTENVAIEEGDGIVFYFAGHGTREYAPKSEDWGLDGDIVECISPQDLDWEAVHGIPSTTINGLFRELASVKGDNITAIFDCCHSGEISRDEERGVRYRYASPPQGHRPVLPSTIDADIRKWWPGREESKRAAKKVVPACFRYDALKSHVLLSACRTDEKAKDGFFTTALIDAMAPKEGTIADLTYAQLFEYVLKPQESQHPQCLGKHKNRLLWNTTVSVVDGFRITVRNWVSPTNKTIIVHAGSVHGIASRTTFTVKAYDETDSVVGTLVVSNLKDLECKCDCQDEPFEIPTGARATVREWNNEELTLNVFVDPTVTGKHTELGQPTIPPQLQDCVHSKDTSEQADLAIFARAKPGDTTVERSDPLMSELAKKIAVDLNENHIQHLITAALHFNFHLYRQPDPLNVLSTVHLELYKLREESVGLPRLVEVDDTNYISRERTVAKYKTYRETVMREAYLTDLEASYGIKIVNNSGRHLYPYLFYFDPTDYSIEEWYYPESPSMPAPLRSRNSLKVGYGARDSASARTIEFSVPPGADSDTGFLKLFLSTSYVDMTSICQEGFTGERQGKMRKIVERELWSAVTYIVTCDLKPSLRDTNA